MQILSMLAQSSEFENMQVREEELPELDRIAIDACPFDIKGGPENKHGKAAILMQVSMSVSRPLDNLFDALRRTESQALHLCSV